MESTFTVRMEKLVYGGKALGFLPDGRAIFVPGALPGELLRVVPDSLKKRYINGKLSEVLEASPQRISPRCPHFGSCGGCHYQMLAYEDQLEAKTQVLLDQMQRLAGIQNPPFSGITASPEPWAYRNQLQFHPDEQGHLCFMDAEERAKLPIRVCFLGQPGLSELWPRVDLGPNSGIRRLALREDSFGELMLLMEGDEALPPEIDFELGVSAVWRGQDGPMLQLAGNDHLHFMLQGQTYLISPESFFQVNLGVTELILSYLQARLEGRQFNQVLELYAGAGLFSRMLARHADQLHAIESSPSSAYDFVDNLQDLEHLSLYEAPVEDALPYLINELKPCDLVFLDPPRSGLHPQAMEALLALEAPEIIYLSCDPSTLARDLKKLLAHGYTLHDLHAFDMFPQTYHVETVVLMSRVKD